MSANNLTSECWEDYQFCFSMVLASDKPDLGLEELQSLNVKERFQVFEQYQSQQTETNELEKANVKRSPSILSKLAK